MSIGKKIFLMLLAIIGLTVGAGALYATTVLNYSTESFSKTYKSIEGQEEDKVIEATEPLAVLLMGVDMDQASRGGNWEDGRSDSMILVTVNPKTQKTTMVSLTRDIMVEIANADGTSSRTVEKLNHSYSYGQAPMAIATVEKMLDININRYVEINMDGLIELVDAVGGITVNNTLGFPISISEHEPVYTSVVDPGVQHINGNQALVYSRMRYDDPEGDIGRQKRQREVIQAVVGKLLQLDGITQYKPILNAVSNNMRTNVAITPSSLPGLLGYKDSLKNIETYQLVGNGQLVDELYYQIPTSEELLEIQNVIKSSLGLPTSTELKTNVRVADSVASIPLINAYTGLPGVTAPIGGSTTFVGETGLDSSQ
ncbi:LytR family transcriptional regulator [Streptococcus sp. zg-86]|uniref:LytR family transcriptional regulator n=1 Tax=Streptococcus zhangguiae TaxID=2664091 RepID=A0A6I4R754_9STRE|nr:MULTISPECIES: LCP family protein [unclassified Streptococcus]MTB63655.1 LytR family transcriptional regulator [Streptococcus sp. zg-86]MTB89965.1 LytR family transcriptional regulator [Streptococcus sp. zg-36]MWV55636.1 LytR family transcriptional regulator [Streptococcus sp. zg-70]QTH48071.1 LCP family protein [Streptococcus sp. zg-86]